MKLIGITQRIDNIEHYLERRDCLDRNWLDFASELGYLAVPLPNLPEDKAIMFLDKIKLDVILLSGGNTISKFDALSKDVAYERDNFEKVLIKYGIENNLPIIGICRGMQMINVFMGGAGSLIEGHISSKHKIKFVNELKNQTPRIVNSFHAWGIKKSELSPKLNILALDDNNNVEAFVSKNLRVLGLMWHPERYENFCQLDVQLIKWFLK